MYLWDSIFLHLTTVLCSYLLRYICIFARIEEEVSQWSGKSFCVAIVWTTLNMWNTTARSLATCRGLIGHTNPIVWSTVSMWSMLILGGLGHVPQEIFEKQMLSDQIWVHFRVKLAQNAFLCHNCFSVLNLPVFCLLANCSYLKLTWLYCITHLLGSRQIVSFAYL